jgi:hypothetical protein
VYRGYWQGSQVAIKMIKLPTDSTAGEARLGVARQTWLCRVLRMCWPHRTCVWYPPAMLQAYGIAQERYLMVAQQGS